MPSRTEKQKKFMTIASHDPEFAKKNKIPVAVAKEYHAADKKLDAKKKSQTKMNHNTRHH